MTNLTGDKMIVPWDAAIPQHHPQEREQARKTLREIPYPPVTEKGMPFIKDFGPKSFFGDGLYF
ncbi:MAG: hypothetical protein M0036_16555 [Desulfobacteraceae bacterium]|nr:hypothetical protein [Desulfobacteraceae bacterium]